MKLTIEELEKIQSERLKKNHEEDRRINLAVKLNICPNCGSELNQNMFERMFDYVKCKKCREKFFKFDDSINNLP